MEYIIVLTIVGFLAAALIGPSLDRLSRIIASASAPRCQTCLERQPRPDWKSPTVECCLRHRLALSVLLINGALVRIWMQPVGLQKDPLQPPSPNLVPHCTRCGHLMLELLISQDVRIEPRTTATPSRDSAWDAEASIGATTPTLSPSDGSWPPRPRAGRS